MSLCYAISDHYVSLDIDSTQKIMSIKYHSLTWACGASLVVHTSSMLVMLFIHLDMA